MFFLGGSVIISIISMTLVLYFFTYPSKGILRIKELEDRKKKYAASFHTQKTLIVGGSDVLYGFNTDFLTQEIGEPVINFGTNIGLGLGFLLDSVKEELQPGDRVIACLAYSLYFNPPYHIFAFEYYRMYGRQHLVKFTCRQWFYYFFGNMKLNMEYKQKQFKVGKSGCYLDVRGTDFPDSKNRPLQFPSIFNQTKSLKVLEEFKDYCEVNKIELWITYPSTLFFPTYAKSAYLQDLQDYLRANYAVIGEADAYFVSLESIFNSVYHVNEQGQRSRTKKISEELGAILKN